MKRIGAILICLTLAAIYLILLPTEVQAATEYEENGYMYTVTDSAATITRVYRPFAGDVTLPSMLGGYSVKKIGAQAFSSCNNLTSVIIPGSVQTIEYGAFINCDDLVSVVISDGTRTIGSHAFANCFALATVTIPGSVRQIGDSAFRACKSLKSVIIPESVITLGNSAFSGCDALTNVTIGSGVTAIGVCAFERCIALTDISIPDSVERIGEMAFYNCAGLSKVIIGDGVNTIDPYAFYSCSSLKNVEFGMAVKVIDEFAFTYCNFADVVLPEGVTSIGVNTFSYNENLEDVELPSSLTRVHAFAFDGCKKLNYKCFDGGKYLGNKSNPYMVLIGTEDKALTSCEVHTDTKLIGNNAFMSCDSLVSVTLPKGIRVIGDGAFYECSHLAAVYFNGGHKDWMRLVIGSGNEDFDCATIVEEYAGCLHKWDENVIKKAPTCSTIGTNTYTCATCGETLTKEMGGMVAHSYADGRCTICGEAEPIEEESLGFFAAIVKFFEDLFRSLLWFLY